MQTKLGKGPEKRKGKGEKEKNNEDYNKELASNLYDTEHKLICAHFYNFLTSEKNIKGRQVGNSKIFGFSNIMVSLLIL